MRLLRLLALLTAGILAFTPVPASATSFDVLDAPTNVQAVHVADTGADLWWNGDARSDEAVIERNVGGTWTPFARGAFGALHLTGLQPGTGYTLRIFLVAPGYTSSPPSAPVSFTTLPGPDTVAPSAPGSMLFSSITTTGASLVWGESTDNVEVTGYHLQQLIGGAWTTIRAVNAFSRFQRVTGLSAGTAYTFAVIAFDARGNASARSAPSTVTTLATTAAPGCQAQIILFSPGFMVTVTITNTTVAPVSGWAVRFNLPAAASVGSAFGGALTRAGGTGTITPPAWGGTISPGGQLMTGFTGSATPFTPPESFTLNGLPCTVV
jgi:chitodextrinase